MFYSNYYMMNEKTHKIYSDKLRLSVVDLTQIELATEEDCYYNIDLWASFFKAETWEAIKMLAEKDPYIYKGSCRRCLPINPGRQDSPAMRSQRGLLSGASIIGAYP
jgi:hypothetical protein